MQKGRIKITNYYYARMEVGFSDIYDVYCDNVDGVDICYRVHYQHILHDEMNGEIEDTIQTPADKSASVFIDCDITTEDGIRTVFGNGEYTWITPLSEYTPS